MLLSPIVGTYHLIKVYSASKVLSNVTRHLAHHVQADHCCRNMNPKKSAAFIASVAKDVKINTAGIRKVAEEMNKALDAGDFKPTNMMIHSYPLPVNEDESSVEWMFVADTLNFSFWALEEDKHYTIELKGNKYTGYMALCAAITRALEDGIPLTSCDYYSNITKEDVHKIFMGKDDEPIPLEDERWRVLQESGKVLKEKFGGSFCKCIEQAGQSAQKLLQIIVENFPSFRDEATIEGKRVALYKRAQILVADIWGLFKGKGLGQFHDIDTITMFADYRVPQSLVHFGALEYTPSLMQLLKDNHMFQNGDREEVEIRGCSIHAVELIREELVKLHPESVQFKDTSLAVNSAMIDYFLWEYRRRFAKELAVIPYHKVRCIYY